MEKRYGFIKSELRAEKKEDGQKIIRGEAIVFDKQTQLYGDIWEEIAPEAIAENLGNIRALYNHNWDIVLGTTDNGTLKLTKTRSALEPEIVINEDDPDAVAAYARVQRGDIQGWSFGFMPTREEHRTEGGKDIFRILEMELFEVSPCVFPAYQQTSIEARQKDLEKIHQRDLTVRKKRILEKTRRR